MSKQPNPFEGFGEKKPIRSPKEMLAYIDQLEKDLVAVNAQLQRAKHDRGTHFPTITVDSALTDMSTSYYTWSTMERNRIADDVAYLKATSIDGYDVTSFTTD